MLDVEKNFKNGRVHNMKSRECFYYFESTPCKDKIIICWVGNTPVDNHKPTATVTKEGWIVFIPLYCVSYVLPHKHTYATTLPKNRVPQPLLAISVTPCLKLQQRDCTCQTSPHINMTCSIHCRSVKSKPIDMKPQTSDCMQDQPASSHPEMMLYF